MEKRTLEYLAIEYKDRLLGLLRERSFRRGTFTLTSGAKSDFFIDCKKVVLSAEGHALVGRIMLSEVFKISDSVLGVAGVELGGCSLASAVALTAYRDGFALDALYVRKQAKDHGSKKQIEGGDFLPAGAPVVVLEDTITTGGSTLHAVDMLLERGFNVVGVVAIVDRREGGADRLRAAGLHFTSLYDRRDFIRGE